MFFFFQAEDGIRDLVRSRGLGDVYKRQGGSGQFGEVHLRIDPWYEGIPDPAGVSVRGKEEHLSLIHI